MFFVTRFALFLFGEGALFVLIARRKSFDSVTDRILLEKETLDIHGKKLYNECIIIKEIFKMKKTKIALLAVLIIVATVLTLSACDFISPDSDKDSINIDEYFTFTYLEDSDSYEIKCKNTALSGEILIPETYNGKPVTSIGNEAFHDCDRLTSVVIPDSVTYISDKAFYDCDSLTKVVIPDSVTYISVKAFYCCFRLTSIEVSENNQYYKSIDSNLYSKDEKNLIRYAAGKNATSFVIPHSVTTIGDYAFYHCFDLASIIIPDSVEIIGSSAFSDCDSLTSLIIPDSVKSIGRSAFDSCEILASVVIPDSVTYIGEDAFNHCENLTNVVIGDSVTSIGNYAFYYCSSLTSVVIPDSVTFIGKGAFQYCSNLQSVVIPDSVTSIDSYAFSDCVSLTDVYYTGTEEEWNQIKISNSGNEYLTNATIHFNYVPEE